MINKHNYNLSLPLAFVRMSPTDCDHLRPTRIVKNFCLKMRIDLRHRQKARQSPELLDSSPALFASRLLLSFHDAWTSVRPWLVSCCVLRSPPKACGNPCPDLLPQLIAVSWYALTRVFHLKQGILNFGLFNYVPSDSDELVYSSLLNSSLLSSPFDLRFDLFICFRISSLNKE